MTQHGSDDEQLEDLERLRRKAAELAAAGDSIGAERLLRQAVALVPSSALAHADLAFLLCRLDRAQAAVALLDSVLERHPQTAWALSTKAAVLAGEHRDEEALLLHDRLVGLAPDVPVLWLNRAHALKILGRVEEAVAAYREALRLDPANGFAWFGLADLRTVPATADEIEAIERASQRKGGGLEEILLHFALGRALGDRGEFERSFRHYETANRLRSHLRPYDATAVSRFVDRSEAVFSREFFDSRASEANRGAEVIFIVGMPRSGTTLLEQTLASHPVIEGLGELFELPNIASRILNGAEASALPERIARLSTEERMALGDQYLTSISRYKRTDRPFVIDKMPSNWQYIALIQSVLPEAKIIDVRRDPVACCWSNFTTYFNRETVVPNSLEELGHHYREYVRLTALIDAALPGRLCRVEYEKLVDAFDANVRFLLDWLGLPFDDACLRFSDNPRAIRTPSAQQVRQPINRQGLRRWQAYEPWLAPLKQALL